MKRKGCRVLICILSIFYLHTAYAAQTQQLELADDAQKKSQHIIASDQIYTPEQITKLSDISNIIHSPPIKVALVVPAGSTFFYFEKMIEIMKAAEISLNIDLTVIQGFAYKTDRNYIYNKILTTVNTPATKPDYIIMSPISNMIEPTLKLTRDKNIKVVTLNDLRLIEDLDNKIYPRQAPNSHWIASVNARQQHYAYLTTKALINHNIKNKIQTKALLLTGGKHTQSSHIRVSGALKAFNELDNQRLTHTVIAQHFIGWAPENAERNIRKINYPPTRFNTVISASDVITQAIVSHYPQHEDYIINGFDWSTEGLNEVAANRVLLSYGGQYIDGLRALLMIYDYHRGLDFIKLTKKGLLQTDLSLATPDNAQAILLALDKKAWGEYDFTQLSRSHDPTQAYRFDIQDILFHSCE